jgi:hypothetical protein
MKSSVFKFFHKIRETQHLGLSTYGPSLPQEPPGQRYTSRCALHSNVKFVLNSTIHCSFFWLCEHSTHWHKAHVAVCRCSVWVEFQAGTHTHHWWKFICTHRSLLRSLALHAPTYYFFKSCSIFYFILSYTVARGIVLYRILGCPNGRDPKFGKKLSFFFISGGLRRQPDIHAAVIEPADALMSIYIGFKLMCMGLGWHIAL